jgi:antitoxin HigA-1
MPIASISSNLIEEGRHGQEVLRAPAHASGSLRQHVLPLGMSAFAKALGVLRQQLHRILAETAPITAEMALRIGKFCDNGAELWLRIQLTYDLWHTRQEMAGTLVHIPTANAA